MKQRAKQIKLPATGGMCEDGDPQPVQQCQGRVNEAFSESAGGSSGEYRGRQYKRECDEDFQMPKRKLQRQHHKRFNHDSYLKQVEKEQVQLAMALSASWMSASAEQNAIIRDPLQVNIDTTTHKKRRKQKKPAIEDSLLLSTSSRDAKQRIAVKMEEMLGNVSEEEIPCTPAFSDHKLAVVALEGGEKTQLMQGKEERELTFVSTNQAEPSLLTPYQQTAMTEPSCKTDHPDSSPLLLAGNDVELHSPAGAELPSMDGMKKSSLPAEKTMYASLAQLGGTASLVYKTLWELSAYCQEEIIDEFFVPALQDVLPPIVKEVELMNSSSLAVSAESVKQLYHSAKPSTAQLQQLLADIHSLMGSSHNADVFLLCKNGRWIPAHKALLACRCPRLSKVLSESEHSLDMSAFDEQPVLAFLEFLYTAQVTYFQSDPELQLQLKELGEIWGVEELVRESWAKEESQTTDECESHDEQHSIHLSTNGKPDVMVSNTSHSSLVTHVCERKKEASPAQVHINSSSTASSDSVFEHIELSPAALSSDGKPDSPAILEQFASQDAARSPNANTDNPKQMEEGEKSSVSKESSYSLSPGMVEAVACSSILLDDLELSFGATVEVVTPAAKAQPKEDMSDVAVTPLPDYRTMATPLLRKECSKFGVKSLPKKHMIAKLEEIYDYSHPIVDETGEVLASEKSVKVSLTESQASQSRKTTRTGKGDDSRQEVSKELVESVKVAIAENLPLYQDILLYKPLELSHIYEQVKAKSVSVSKDRLANVLDQLCVIYTIPRQQHMPKKMPPS